MKEEIMMQPPVTIDFPEVAGGFSIEIAKPVTQEFVDVLTDEIRNGESRHRFDTIYNTAGAGDRLELAELLSKVLRHRLTPTRLYNTIVDELYGVPEEHTTSPEFIAQSLVESFPSDTAAAAATAQ